MFYMVEHNPEISERYKSLHIFDPKVLQEVLRTYIILILQMKATQVQKEPKYSFIRCQSE